MPQSTLNGAVADTEAVSAIDLFLNAGILVQSVMVGLLIASVWSWAIVFEKGMLFWRLKTRTLEFEQVFWSGKSLESLFQYFRNQSDNPFAQVFIAAMREWRRGSDAKVANWTNVGSRVEKAMEVAISREVEAMDGRLLFLASTGSTAPFVGLFGTVWGIMNSFQAIAATRNTSLDVVAPGIAEALLATAMGLFAAIPAVVFYNKFSSESAKYSEKMENFASEFSTILSRQSGGGS